MCSSTYLAMCSSTDLAMCSSTDLAMCSSAYLAMCSPTDLAMCSSTDLAMCSSTCLVGTSKTVCVLLNVLVSCCFRHQRERKGACLHCVDSDNGYIKTLFNHYGGGENKRDIQCCFIVCSTTKKQLHDAIPIGVSLERKDTIPNGIIDLRPPVMPPSVDTSLVLYQLQFKFDTSALASSESCIP